MFLIEWRASGDVNLYGLLVLAVAIALCASVAIIAAPKVAPAVENIDTSLDVIQDSTDKICKIDNLIYERLVDALGDDSAVQSVLNQMDAGQMTPSCGYSMLNLYLDEESRKKVRWHEIACDIGKCLE